jgi:hypothetical protein
VLEVFFFRLTFAYRMQKLFSFTITSKVHGTHKIIVDRLDKSLVLRHTWHLRKSRNIYYAATRIDKSHLRSLHQMILRTKKGTIVDHKNCNGLDNRRLNLRLSDKSKNASNRGIPSNNTSGYKGVSWNKNEQKYQAYICFNWKKIHLGYFLEIRPAAIAYNKAALIYHGEFAKLNPI